MRIQKRKELTRPIATGRAPHGDQNNLQTLAHRSVSGTSATLGLSAKSWRGYLQQRGGTHGRVHGSRLIPQR